MWLPSRRRSGGRRYEVRMNDHGGSSARATTMRLWGCCLEEGIDVDF